MNDIKHYKTCSFVAQDGKKRRIYLHRLIWQTINGSIPNGYVIHHINGDIHDNRIDNLVCLSRTEHAIKHQWKGGFEAAQKRYLSKTEVKEKRNKWQRNRYKDPRIKAQTVARHRAYNARLDVKKKHAVYERQRRAKLRYLARINIDNKINNT